MVEKSAMSTWEIVNMYTQINTTQISTIRIGQYPKLSTNGNDTNRDKICQFSSQMYRITGTCTSIRSYLKRAPENVPWCLKNLAYQCWVPSQSRHLNTPALKPLTSNVVKTLNFQSWYTVVPDN